MPALVVRSYPEGTVAAAIAWLQNPGTALELPNDGRTQLWIKNDELTPLTATAAAKRKCNHGGTHNRVDTIGAERTAHLLPFDRYRFNNALGRVEITLDRSSADIYAAAVRLLVPKVPVVDPLAHLMPANSYTVTTLADSGAGSLRDAVSVSDRYVNFAVSGLIELAGSLQITQPRLFLDFLNAPGPITVRHAVADEHPALDIYQTGDVVLRGATIRAPLVHPGPANHDCLRIFSSQSVIVNRCTLLEAEDECIDIGGTPLERSSDIEISECLLADTSDPSFDHGKGILSYWAERVLVYRCAFRNFSYRAPMILSGSLAMVNCLITDPWLRASQIFPYDYGGAVPEGVTADFEGNLYVQGPHTDPGIHWEITHEEEGAPWAGPASLWVSGNRGWHRTSDEQDEWDIVAPTGEAYTQRGSRFLTHGKPVASAVTLANLDQIVGAPA